MKRDVATPIPVSGRGGTRITGLSLLLLAVAVGLVVLGLVYFTTTSAHLPAFLPGHYERFRGAGHVAQARKHHVKLGLLSFGLALAAAVAAWYAAAPEDAE